MPYTSSSGSPGRLTAAAVLLSLSACSFPPPPAHARPPLAPRAELAAAPIATPAIVRLESESSDRWRGALRGEGETVEFELLSERRRDRARPLVLLVPILAGGASLMEFVASDLYGRGFDVAWCKRAGSAMQRGQRGPDLQELFRRTVRHQRLLLRWLRDFDDAQPRPQFVLGISLGGMIATAVAALEPELDGVALCLSGGDLGSLVPTSDEARVRKWVEWRQETDGVGLDHVRWELHELVRLDPVAMAAAVATAKVLFVSAGFDDVVPASNQDLLWEALGRPARLTLPLGHYSAALAIDTVLTAATTHFRSRIVDAPPASPTAAHP